MKKVIHAARKFLPPTASFIYNQIIYHEQYEPLMVYCEDSASVFRDKLHGKISSYSAVNGGLGKFLYQYLRKLSPSDQRKLRLYLQSQSPDIMHVHYGVDALVFSNLYKYLKIPVLVSFYGYDCTSFPNRFRGLGKTWLNKRLFENPYVTKYTAMSPDMKEDLVKLGCPEEKIIVHYHGSDTQPFFLKRKYLNNQAIHLLIVGSLTPKKGHLFLLKALKQAQEKTQKELHLNIVGDGELRNELEHFIQQEKIENVRMHGAIPYGSEQHLNLLKEADIYIHPSITTEQGEKEGIPGALIESRSSGLPVITTKHAGIPYIIEQGETGLMAKENDVEALASHIQMLAEDTGLREKMGKAGQKFTLETLDVRKKEKELERIYDAMIEEYP